MCCRRAVFLAGMNAMHKVHARISANFHLDDSELGTSLHTNEAMTLEDQARIR